MTIYHTAYDTTACSGFRMQPIVEAILEAMVREPLDRADNIVFIDSVAGACSQVKAFKHPLYIHKWTNPQDWRGARGGNDDPNLAMDLRPSGRFDAKTGRFKVTNSTVHKALIYRAALTSMWLMSGALAFRSISPMAMSIFASWLGEAIGFKYGLDPKTKIDIMIVAGIFYQSNHTEGIEFDKNKEDGYLAGIAGSLKLNILEVKRVYAQTQAILSIEDFCNKVKLVTGNVRLENLNHGVLIALMGGTWAGDNAVELTAVAMEHPPTWISLIYEAATNLALKKVGLAKIVERSQYKEGLERLGHTLKTGAFESTRLIDRVSTLR